MSDYQEENPRLVQSQPAIFRPKINFHWICLFDWDENNENPFEIHLREVSNGIIPDSWFDKPLREECRFQKAKFKTLGSRVFSFFCKIEYGKPQK